MRRARAIWAMMAYSILYTVYAAVGMLNPVTAADDEGEGDLGDDGIEYTVYSVCCSRDVEPCHSTDEEGEGDLGDDGI